MKFSLILKRRSSPQKGLRPARPAPRPLIYVNKSANLWGFGFRIWCASCCCSYCLEEEAAEEPAQGVPRARTNMEELAEETWHCCGQLRSLSNYVWSSFVSISHSLLSVCVCVWYGKKAKGSGKAKANKHANKPSHVESSLSCRRFLWHHERGQFHKGIHTFSPISSIRSVSPSMQRKSKRSPNFLDGGRGYLGITYKSMRNAKSKSPIGLCGAARLKVAQSEALEKRKRTREKGEKKTEKKRVTSYLSPLYFMYLRMRKPFFFCIF